MEFEQTIVNVRRWEIYFRNGKRASEAGNFAEAEDQFNQALNEAAKFGEGDPRLANIHNSLADAYGKDNKPDLAEPHYRRVIDIWESALGPDYSGLVDVLENYGKILKALNRESDAKEALDRAAAIQENVQKMQHMDGRQR